MGRHSEARVRILDAAMNLLWEKSYHALTIDQVCARAEVRKGSLYHFFSSKGALASEALQHFWVTIAQPAYQKHFSETTPALSQISSFVRWMRAFQLEIHRKRGKVLGWPFFTLGCELAGTEPEIAETLSRIAALEKWYFESALSQARRQNGIDGFDPRIASLLATIEGILGRARSLNEPDELDALLSITSSHE